MPDMGAGIEGIGPSSESHLAVSSFRQGMPFAHPDDAWRARPPSSYHFSDRAPGEPADELERIVDADLSLFDP
jgi:hypothetical protein